ncbi:sirohydrochlorin cobaltochelatase [Desulfonema ishimotonii]|uniref:Sirohydrochlorin cobaltochelatase n=1 Tax=Desulfonema ishimotonii TaxID=45657 RepID=A0A401FZX8_9BACT|nr:sirohydrochlorin cobaltochelatase [Desulfonema ishimotonii]GBC62542.1 sirohydrochlorin cobaltochelatase [Desulfonema ishimotonii]
MNTPIVMAAFGTTTRALETYKFMDAVFRERFPEADIRWAYSSRMVRDWIKVRRDIDLRHPHEVLNDLIGEGHGWAVVQSLHMMCGHEFSRLIEEVRGAKFGHPWACPCWPLPEITSGLPTFSVTAMSGQTTRPWSWSATGPTIPHGRATWP